MNDDIADAIETVRVLRAAGLTSAEIIAAVGQPMPRDPIGGDDAVDAVMAAWATLLRPEWRAAA